MGFALPADRWRSWSPPRHGTARRARCPRPSYRQIIEPRDRSAEPVSVELLITPGCPNAAPLADFLSGLARVTLLVTTVDSDGPMPAGFAGSPTVLVEGANPFSQETVADAACALHPPTVDDLRQVLEPEPVGP